MRSRNSGSVLLALSVVLPFMLASCGVGPRRGLPGFPVTPEERAESLLVNLAWINPRVAEPLVKGFSAAALEEALGLVVTAGLEDAGWAEGLLQDRWWMAVAPEDRLLGEGGVRQVMTEVHRRGPGDGVKAEERQKEIHEALEAGAAAPSGGEGGASGPPSGAGSGDPQVSAPRGGAGSGSETGRQDARKRAELEDAVRWVQFMEAWSSYYQAMGVESSGGFSLPGGSDRALDQAVSMSLVRPDFLDRLAALMAESLGSFP